MGIPTFIVSRQSQREGLEKNSACDVSLILVLSFWFLVCFSPGGWGQEDDDFYYRLAAKFGTVNRLAPEDGRYRAMSHPRVQGLDETPVFSKGTQHLTETRMGTFDTKTDGISNLQFRLQAVEKWEKWPRGVRKFVAELTFENMPKDLSGRTE
jgi:hypothetical protein